MSPDDIDYLVTHFERPWYQNYRDVLIKRYGPYQHIMTGVHVNFSLADALIKWFGAEKQIQSFPVAKNTLYFQIAQQVANYRWLLTYLFGASPVTENVTDNLPRDFKDIEPVRSWRASNFGFVNHFDQQIDYTDLSTYIGQIKHFVKTGDYYDKSEFYGPVRLKAPGSLDDLRQRGTAYLEFRMFDINPFSLDGISQNELSFLHLLIIDSIMNPQEWSNAATKEARMLNHVVATQHPNDSLSASLDQEIEPLFSRLNKIVNFSPIELREDFSRSLIFAEKALKNPELTIGAQLSKHIDNHSLTQFALSRGQQILSERKIIDNNFVFTPSHLKQMYIQAHKLGFKTLVLDNQNLQVSYKNHVQSFKNNENLTKYMQTKK
ncbi:hypothetical protein GCM10025879_11190 [Leuconostoc litchii]|nr:hypothetical protein GCM10025879_11190 [Leuconostoc litchii]